MRPCPAHPAHQAHSAMLMLDCPDDFHRENRSFSAFKKNWLHRDGPTDGQTDRQTDTHSYRDARTHLINLAVVEASDPRGNIKLPRGMSGNHLLIIF